MIGRRKPSVAVAAGERVLAWCHDGDGRVVAGTRDALYLPRPASEAGEPLRVPWEQVEAADWDADASVLRVSEVGTWGAPRPVHRLVLVQPTLLLQLVRERVTATVVLQRHVPIAGRRGLRVIARRAPAATVPSPGSTSSTRASTPPIRPSGPPRTPLWPWPRTRSATRPPDFLRTPAPC